MAINSKFKQSIDQAEVIFLTTHFMPDADGIGSQVALASALKRYGKTVFCVLEKALPQRFDFVNEDDLLITIEDFEQGLMNSPTLVDLILVLDTNQLNRVGEKVKKFCARSRAALLYIDHHPCEKKISKDHCIDDSAAATAQVVGGLIQSLNLEFTKQEALALYTAIVVDTSSFRYPTVTGKTHRLVAELIDAGVSPSEAFNNVSGAKKMSSLHLLGKILTSARINQRGDVAWIFFDNDQLDEFATDSEDTNAYINNLLVLEGMKVACMFRLEDEYLKVSLRSLGKYDVGVIAETLGGGGHGHAAAARIECRDVHQMPLIIKKVISIIEKQISIFSLE